MTEVGVRKRRFQLIDLQRAIERIKKHSEKSQVQCQMTAESPVLGETLFLVS